MNLSRSHPTAPSTERAAWLAWSRVPDVGPVLLQRLQRAFGSLAAAWQAAPGDLTPIEGIGPQRLAKILAGRSAIDPEQLLADWTQKNPQFWTPADPDYPQLLRELPDFPALLYYRGQPHPAELQGTQPLVAIVGTRQPSDYGQRWTNRLTTCLTKAGFGIVSGLAEGVDAESHRACLAAGGRTIAVLGTGVDRVYPTGNRDLYGRIVGTFDYPGSGFALSEYPSGTGPDRAHFPRRNRIVAGLARATIVIEGGERSGALITANQAADYGRDVYVLPGSLDMPLSAGCLKLINSGAQVILSENHLLDCLGALPQLDRAESATVIETARSPVPGPAAPGPTPTAKPAVAPMPPPPNLAPAPAAVLRAIDPTPTALDAIVAASGLSPGNVMAALTELELLGLVENLPGMRYRRA